MSNNFFVCTSQTSVSKAHVLAEESTFEMYIWCFKPPFRAIFTNDGFPFDNCLSQERGNDPKQWEEAVWQSLCYRLLQMISGLCSCVEKAQFVLYLHNINAPINMHMPNISKAVSKKIGTCNFI